MKYTKMSWDNNTKLKLTYYKDQDKYTVSIFMDGKPREMVHADNRNEAEEAAGVLVKNLGVTDNDIIESLVLLLEYDGSAKIIKGVEHPSTTLNFHLS